jgi:hypothetical protein
MERQMTKVIVVNHLTLIVANGLRRPGDREHSRGVRPTAPTPHHTREEGPMKLIEVRPFQGEIEN